MFPEPGVTDDAECYGLTLQVFFFIPTRTGRVCSGVGFGGTVQGMEVV